MAKAAEKFILKDIRGSYVFISGTGHVRDDGDDPQWEMQVIMPKDHPQLDKLKKTMWKVATTAFGKGIKPKMISLPLRDGDEEKEEEEYEGCHFFNVKTYRPPGVVKRNGKAATAQDIEALGYSGCYFTLSITFKNYDHPEGGKGVRGELNHVMLLREGERLDGTTSASEDFADEIDEDTEDEIDFDDLDDEIPF